MTATISDTSAWLEALDIQERVAWVRAGYPSEQLVQDSRTAWRVSKWRAMFRNAPTQLETAVQVAGMTFKEFEDAISTRFAELSPPDRNVPGWVRDLEATCSRWSGDASAVRGFVVRGIERLRDGIAREGSVQLPILSDAVASQLENELTRTLSSMCLKTFVLELNAARLLGTLVGSTPQERYRYFVDSIGAPSGARRFYSTYPVLARKLGTTADGWADALAECIRRLCHDRRALDESFGAGQALGSLASVSGAAGDTHANHRTVRILTFESGIRVVYKPRPLDLDRHFHELLCWLNDRGWDPEFRPRRSLLRGNYGWSEYVRSDDCSTPDMVRRFYQRHGGLLAVTFLLSANDFHHENVVASGEHPCLVDVETLFRAPLTSTAPPPAVTGPETRTVIAVGLLPHLQMATAESKGFDISGIGGRGGQRLSLPLNNISQSGTDEMCFLKEHIELRECENRPTLDGTAVDPLAYCDEVVSGFGRMYDLIMTCRNEFMRSDGPLLRFADDPVRVIVRPTRTYGTLLQDALHPDVVQSGLDQSRLFDSLWSFGDVPPSVVRAEQRDLRNGDVPLFTSRANSTSISASDGERIDAVLARSGLSLVTDRVSQMNSDDKARQIWHIRSAYQIGNGRPTRSARPRNEPVALRTKAVAIATNIGSKLAQLAFDASADPVWSTVRPVGTQSWRITNVSDDLYSGRGGIVLFLAHLARETGDADLQQLCKNVARTLGRDLRERGVEGVGGYTGTSGTVYVLAHLGAMWRDVELVERATALTRTLLPQMESDRVYDVLGGSAGSILALLACEEILSGVDVIPIVVAAGDRLLQSAVPQEPGCGWLVHDRPLTGFAHGVAGIGCALARLAGRVGDARYADCARRAFDYERSVFSESQQNWPDFRKDTEATVGGPGYGATWCNGAAGIGLSRAFAARWLDGDDMWPEVRIAVRTTLALGDLPNHSLCHGELGNLECLSLAAGSLGDSRLINEVARRQVAAVDSIDQKGVVCGSDTDVALETPGLMAGLAGVGYGLLRIASPSSVPCVLSLEGPPA
jgi:type 2 lantibiotic biosynthesis protein LanM